jgi:glycerol uptake facilitator-like aquaporin
VSGANINPAVTIALLCTLEIDLVRAAFYIFCQLVGSTLAIYMLRELVPEHIIGKAMPATANNEDPLANIIGRNSSLPRFHRSITDIVSNGSARANLLPEAATSVSAIPIGMTLLDKSISPAQGLLCEAIITFILIFTVFACIDSKRNDLNGSFPLTIGFAVVIGCLFGVSFSIFLFNLIDSLS